MSETGENNPAPVDITVASPEPNMLTQPVDDLESKQTCQVERQVHEVSQETMSSIPSSAVNVSDQDRAKPPNSSRISVDQSGLDLSLKTPRFHSHNGCTSSIC